MTTGLRTKTEADNDWILEFSGIQKAWEYSAASGKPSRGDGIVIVHADTGFTEHPELLKGSRLLIAEGRNFIEEPGSPPTDPLKGLFPFAFPSHGTGTGSVIMSGEGHPFTIADPELEGRYSPPYSETHFVTGVAPLAKLVPCRVATSVILNDMSDANLALALYHAIALASRDTLPLNVGVVCASLGRRQQAVENSLRSAVLETRNKGIIICCAAGQLSEHMAIAKMFKPMFPSCDANAVCVAACLSNHEMLTGAFYGSAIDITAPGKNIWRAWSDKRRQHKATTISYTVSQSYGTSHANAIVAGSCALWQAHWGRDWLLNRYTPELLLDLFKFALAASADTRGDSWDTLKNGAGVLDVEALLTIDLTKIPKDTVSRLAADEKTKREKNESQNGNELLFKNLSTAERRAKLGL